MERHPRLRTALFFSFLFCANSVFASAPICAEAFGDEKSSFALMAVGDVKSLAAHLETQNPRLQTIFRLIQNGLAERVAKDPDFFALTERLKVGNVDSLNATDQTHLQDSYFGLSLTLRKSINAQRIIFSIPGVFMKDTNGVNVRANTKPQGLDQSFPKVLISILASAAHEMKNNSEIKEIEIVGAAVLNERLVVMFKEMGFLRRQVVQVPTYYADYDVAFMAGGGDFGMRQFGNPQPTGATGQWDATHPDHGQNWVLVLPVRP